MSTFIKEVSDYLQALSTAHKDIVHNTINSYAFCRFQDQQQFNQLVQNSARNIVVVMNFFGRSSGSFDDATVTNTIVVRFSVYAKLVTSQEITIAVEKSFSIMMQFWSRMRYDFEQDNCEWMRWINWEGIQFDEIEQPWLQNHYGWELAIPYKTHLPEFDQTKWNDIP